MDKSHVDDGRKKAVELKIEERGKRKEGNRIFKGKKSCSSSTLSNRYVKQNGSYSKNFFLLAVYIALTSE